MTFQSKVLLSHPGCPPFAQEAARALYEAGLLSYYATTFSYKPEETMGQLLRLGLRLSMRDPHQQLKRRQITSIPDNFVVRHPFPELFRTAVSKAALGPVAADLIWDKAERWFDRTVARNDLNGERAAYCFEYAALETFRKQRGRGGVCLYDLPSAHHKTTAALLEPEIERFPELRTDYVNHLKRLAPGRNARKDEELNLADHVIVASNFTKASLTRVGYPEPKVSVVPYGAPPVKLRGPRDKSRPVVFLSAGTQSIGKGVHHTLEAWRKVSPSNGSAELWLVGHMQLPKRLLVGLPGKFVVRPTVTKRELSKIYAAADVLLFPTLFDGFGMVITEAMAHGLPVITTPNSAGPEQIVHGENGFIIPICDTDALAELMQWCLDSPKALAEIGERALATAACWQWSDYRAQLGNVVAKLLAVQDRQWGSR